MRAYTKFGGASGSYRKALLRTECKTAIDRYDAVSRLRIRVKTTESLPDIHLTKVKDLEEALTHLKEDITVLAGKTGSPVEEFSIQYDKLASAYDGIMETLFGRLADSELSEDAAILKKQNYTQKTRT